MAKRRSYKTELEGSLKKIEFLQKEINILENTIRKKEGKKNLVFSLEILIAGIGVLIAGLVALQVYKQTGFIDSQTKIFDNQNQITENQNDILEKQNLLIESQNSLYFDQNGLLDIQTNSIKKQNKLLSIQNKNIELQTYLSEAERRGALILMMNNVLDQVNDELKEDYLKDSIRNLSQELIDRITVLSYSFTPYRFLDGEQLIQEPLSPERGLLLTSLILNNLDSITYYKIYARATFEFSDLRKVRFFKANLRGAQLNHSNFQGSHLILSDLRFAELRYCNFSYLNAISTDLSHSDLSHSDLSHSNILKGNLSDSYFYKTIFNMADLSNTKLGQKGIWDRMAQHQKIFPRYYKNEFDDISVEESHNSFMLLLNKGNFDLNIPKKGGLTFNQLSKVYSISGCEGLDTDLVSALKKNNKKIFDRPPRNELLYLFAR